VRAGGLGALAVTAVAVLVLTLSTAVGSGPPRLTAVTPGDDSSVAVAPSQVALTFSQPPDLARSHIAVAGVAGGAGAPNSAGQPRLSGQTVLLPLSGIAPGTYVVGYHVVFGDGRELSGLTRFTVARGGSGPAPSVRPTGPSTEEPAEAAAGHDHGAADPAGLGLVLADAVLVAGLVVVMLRRPRVRG
jgi:copper resistance protein C